MDNIHSNAVYKRYNNWIHGPKGWSLNTPTTGIKAEVYLIFSCILNDN